MKALLAEEATLCMLMLEHKMHCSGLGRRHRWATSPSPTSTGGAHCKPSGGRWETWAPAAEDDTTVFVRTCKHCMIQLVRSLTDYSTAGSWIPTPLEMVVKVVGAATVACHCSTHTTRRHHRWLESMVTYRLKHCHHCRLLLEHGVHTSNIVENNHATNYRQFATCLVGHRKSQLLAIIIVLHVFIRLHVAKESCKLVRVLWLQLVCNVTLKHLAFLGANEYK